MKKTSKKSYLNQSSAAGLPLYCWNNVSLAPEDFQALNQFAQSPKSVKFEKLKGCQDVYSIRVTKKRRILLTKYQGMLIIIGLLPNHEYERKLKSLSRDLLKKLNKNIDVNLDLQEPFQEMDNIPFTIERKDAGKNRVTFESRKDGTCVLLFDEYQNQALQVTMPAFISGLPGSGKTTVAAALCHCADKLKDNQKILFTTQSKGLIHKIRQELREYSPELEDKIDLYTYSELLNTDIAFELNPSKTFKEFFQEFKKILLKRPNLSETQKKCMNSDINTLYQELRILCGYEEKDYKDIKVVGRKNSHFNDHDDQRELMVNIYESFKVYCEDKDIHIEAFEPISNPPMHYEMVLADECQDLSNLQLRSLIKNCLKPDSSQIVLFYGDGQSLHDDIPSKHFAQECLKEHGTMNSVVLKNSHRCPANTLALANEFNVLRKQFTLTGKQEADMVPEKSTSQEMGVIEHHPLNREYIKTIKEKMDLNPNMCLVTTSQQIEYLIKEYGFKNYQLFTSTTIKGLQYESVVMYQPFDHPDFKSIHNQMNKNIEKGTPYERQAKYNQAFSELVVNITRGIKEVIIISDSHYQHLNNIVEKYITTKDTRKVLNDEYQLTLQWQERAKSLHAAGRSLKAFELLKDKLGYTERECQDFLDVTEAQNNLTNRDETHDMSPNSDKSSKPKATKKGKKRTRKQKKANKPKGKTPARPAAATTAQKTYYEDDKIDNDIKLKPTLLSDEELASLQNLSADIKRLLQEECHSRESEINSLLDKHLDLSNNVHVVSLIESLLVDKDMQDIDKKVALNFIYRKKLTSDIKNHVESTQRSLLETAVSIQCPKTAKHYMEIKWISSIHLKIFINYIELCDLKPNEVEAWRKIYSLYTGLSSQEKHKIFKNLSMEDLLVPVPIGQHSISALDWLISMERRKFNTPLFGTVLASESDISKHHENISQAFENSLRFMPPSEQTMKNESSLWVSQIFKNFWMKHQFGDLTPMIEKSLPDKAEELDILSVYNMPDSYLWLALRINMEMSDDGLLKLLIKKYDKQPQALIRPMANDPTKLSDTANYLVGLYGYEKCQGMLRHIIDTAPIETVLDHILPKFNISENSIGLLEYILKHPRFDFSINNLNQLNINHSSTTGPVVVGLLVKNVLKSNCLIEKVLQLGHQLQLSHFRMYEPNKRTTLNNEKRLSNMVVGLFNMVGPVLCDIYFNLPDYEFSLKDLRKVALDNYSAFNSLFSNFKDQESSYMIYKILTHGQGSLSDAELGLTQQLNVRSNLNLQQNTYLAFLIMERHAVQSFVASLEIAQWCESFQANRFVDELTSDRFKLIHPSVKIQLAMDKISTFNKKKPFHKELLEKLQNIQNYPTHQQHDDDVCYRFLEDLSQGYTLGNYLSQMNGNKNSRIKRLIDEQSENLLLMAADNDDSSNLDLLLNQAEVKVVFEKNLMKFLKSFIVQKNETAFRHIFSYPKTQECFKHYTSLFLYHAFSKQSFELFKLMIHSAYELGVDVSKDKLLFDKIKDGPYRQLIDEVWPPTDTQEDIAGTETYVGDFFHNIDSDSYEAVIHQFKQYSFNDKKDGVELLSEQMSHLIIDKPQSRRKI